jgi:hypothetical protein
LSFGQNNKAGLSRTNPDCSAAKIQFEANWRSKTLIHGKYRIFKINIQGILYGIHPPLPLSTSTCSLFLGSGKTRDFIRPSRCPCGLEGHTNDAHADVKTLNWPDLFDKKRSS